MYPTGCVANTTFPRYRNTSGTNVSAINGSAAARNFPSTYSNRLTAVEKYSVSVRSRRSGHSSSGVITTANTRITIEMMSW